MRLALPCLRFDVSMAHAGGWTWKAKAAEPGKVAIQIGRQRPRVHADIVNRQVHEPGQHRHRRTNLVYSNLIAGARMQHSAM